MGHGEEGRVSDQRRFYGDANDLEAFRRLIASPIRTDARELALHDWERYKIARQIAFVRGSWPRDGAKVELSKVGDHWDKGDYISSLTVRAIDLRGASFHNVILGYADLRGVQFDDCTFTSDRGWTALKGARLQNASLRNARFDQARLMDADLQRADLTGARLPGADLTDADLSGATLEGADLSGANLERANFVGADLRRADLHGSRIYGIAAWDIKADAEAPALQRDLVVTPPDEPAVVVDNIEVAQFVYLLLSNPKIRGVIDTVCKKGVLILGRFTPERKVVLDALRDEFRRRGFIPMVFDFERPEERDITETVRTLAGMSRFIVADITNPRSSPLELQATVPDYQVPFVPLIAEGERPFSMFADLRNKYSWVLDPLEYSDAASLIRTIESAIINPALRKHAELQASKAEIVRTRHVRDYLDD